MKRFLLIVTLFSLPVFGGFLTLCYLADGKTDPYYLRFTSARQSSLIIGTSRAAQGLRPAVFNELIFKNREQRFYNYSFSLADSPYGPAYLASIQKKIDPDTKNGIFIVTVDPWSISVKNGSGKESEGFPEDSRFVGRTKSVNKRPNYGYLLHSFSEPFINIFHNWRKPGFMFLHDDGWLELKLPLDSTLLAVALENKIKIYREEYLPTYSFSPIRFEYLVKTIRFLQNHGEVYLVRMPVHQQMFDIEDELMPEFDNRMGSITTEQVPYLNFKALQQQYIFSDGNHVHEQSANAVSACIAEWINTCREQRQIVKNKIGID